MSCRKLQVEADGLGGCRTFGWSVTLGTSLVEGINTNLETVKSLNLEPLCQISYVVDILGKFTSISALLRCAIWVRGPAIYSFSWQRSSEARQRRILKGLLKSHILSLHRHPEFRAFSGTSNADQLWHKNDQGLKALTLPWQDPFIPSMSGERSLKSMWACWICRICRFEVES